MDILSIEFTAAGQMKITVQMPEKGRFTTHGLPHLPRRLFRLFPELSKHKCENDFGYSFRRECQDTELPHLLEHLIIELQSMIQPSGVLRGQTVWDWRRDPRGQFHVYVDYTSEVVAIVAARLAERIIKAIDSRDVDLTDIELEVGRLHEMARLSREMAAALPDTHAHSWETTQAESLPVHSAMEPVPIAA
ncbi:MAG TPA: hypothetical protein VGM37_04440 [Armatimonadota bacterium]